MKKCEFIGENGTFRLTGAQRYRDLYFPIAGEYGLKSAVTPQMAGDAKLDQNHFLYEPVSSCDIQNRRFSRNFWVMADGCEPWSAMGCSSMQRAAVYTEKEETITVTAGYMWQEIKMEGKYLPVTATTTMFIPVDRNLEVIRVEIENTGDAPLAFESCFAIPLYGRSADNLRDHRHVTGLLHRTSVENNIISVNPTLSFDERGHQLNDTIYFANAKSEGQNPDSFYVNQNDFIGECGDFERPEALFTHAAAVANGYCENGQEAMAGFRFAKTVLQPGEKKQFLCMAGVCHTAEEIGGMLADLSEPKEVEYELTRTRQYWQNKVNLKYHTADENFDRFMDWVNFQPELRRLFGCSFLPHHDYGKGGRGWRDLWQDCLALLLMNPSGVRQMLISNFAGVRIDGTNATIIGEHLGEFKADRNSITRVWMDHGLWPFKTTKLYIDQTGDLDILNQEVSYFKDRQVMRGTEVDNKWTEQMHWQEDTRGKEYHGTILEHLILQNLTAFWEVGEHNHLRLRDADWNDALDMAGDRGESVAFTCAYSQNLLELADLMDEYAKTNPEILLLQEAAVLLRDEDGLFDTPEYKQTLIKEYGSKVRHVVAGIRIPFATETIAQNLRAKGIWLQEHLRKTEWIEDPIGGGWYNSYYDNDGNALESAGENAHMMLTGQVFAIMSKTATDDQVKQICEAADRYLYDANCGGYRLNNDFGEIRTNMGRMFGFAFGEKENGAVFSHMAVMYANALYSRGFAKEGYRSMDSLFRQSMDFDKSHIYPGIPEYFGRGGRGLYAYLTGAASWYLLTVVNQMFGVRGQLGDLVVEPKLLASQFDESGIAEINLKFLGHEWTLRYENPNHLEYGSYRIQEATCNDQALTVTDGCIVIPKNHILNMDARVNNKIVVHLNE